MEWKELRENFFHGFSFEQKSLDDGFLNENFVEKYKEK